MILLGNATIAADVLTGNKLALFPSIGYGKLFQTIVIHKRVVFKTKYVIILGSAVTLAIYITGDISESATELPYWLWNMLASAKILTKLL
jgi:hypothetical protein